MPIFGPNTLGTLVILLATIALIVVLASAPHHPNLYFLAATVNSKASNLNQAGIIKLGVFGYCISTEQGTEVCPPPSIGYALDPKVMFGLPELPEMIKLSDNIIRNMTKVLVLHVLATILAGLAFISGLVSHIEEFSKTCWTSCFASMSASVTLLVTIFDLIFFSIIKARINAMKSSDQSISAQFGNALGLTIVAWILLAFSGCFFCAGRCLCSFRRHKRSNEHHRLEPFTSEKSGRQYPPYH
ncbi:uncharacterized protein PGTG_07783 [Puccinia graminis f. sp. tritici CRL 75-36-700-3]|uniref:MARVEL domain-containing protein n=1 Tax=Puccinia graminis f. sp. tritici (strain CRL 75-36-700-3 / race SCCL) TaxID=418459 RepID=E3KBS1_PUCGT|nr:uncharacterized protein PGTG_07783 [Puccinia graminis f. sp. tritici CRL 75-36-700-3]EFP81534.2 hypothetical protein PGTG_07783 [Puccinia graminis f. sp. tritici CRL 75-36-700-3]